MLPGRASRFTGAANERGGAVVPVLVLIGVALLAVAGVERFGSVAGEKYRCQGQAVRSIGSGDQGPGACGTAEPEAPIPSREEFRRRTYRPTPGQDVGVADWTDTRLIEDRMTALPQFFWPRPEAKVGELRSFDSCVTPYYCALFAPEPCGPPFLCPEPEESSLEEQLPEEFRPPLPPRPVEFYRNQRVEGPLFLKGPDDDHAIHPNDIRLGKLGNCSLHAVLAACAQNEGCRPLLPALIQESPDGTYSVTFHGPTDRPFWRFWEPRVRRETVTVPPSFPYAPKNEQFLFARGADFDGEQEEIWPQAYEAAWAKWKGSYGETES